MKSILPVAWDIPYDKKNPVSYTSIPGVCVLPYRQILHLLLNSSESFLNYGLFSRTWKSNEVHHIEFFYVNFFLGKSTGYMEVNAKLSNWIVWARLFSFCASLMHITAHNLTSISSWVTNLVGGSSTFLETAGRSPEILLITLSRRRSSTWWIHAVALWWHQGMCIVLRCVAGAYPH